tara:strand:+ start:9910 stop:11133 length:1224 start_codon:yes stop_codon:yes gene_type:complete
MSTKHGTAVASTQYTFTESPHHVRGTFPPHINPSKNKWRSVFHLDANGTVIWAYDTGNYVLGVGIPDYSAPGAKRIMWAVGYASWDWFLNDGTRATAWKLSNFGKPLATALASHRLYKVDVDDTNNAYVVGIRSTEGTGSNASVWRINENGTIEWGYDTGANVNDVYVSSVGVHVAGVRSSSKSIWTLDKETGALISDYDLGQAGNGISGDGTNIFATASPSATWEDSTGPEDRANVWKFTEGLTNVYGVLIGHGGQGGESISAADGNPVIVGFGAGDDIVYRLPWDEDQEGFPTGDAPAGISVGAFTTQATYSGWTGDIVKNIIAGGIGFNPGNVKFILTRGFANESADKATVVKFAGTTAVWGWMGDDNVTPHQAWDVIWDSGSGHVWVGHGRTLKWESTAKTPN